MPPLQDRTPVTGKPEKLLDLKGTDLLGLPVKVRCGSGVCPCNALGVVFRWWWCDNVSARLGGASPVTRQRAATCWACPSRCAVV